MQAVPRRHGDMYKFGKCMPSEVLHLTLKNQGISPDCYKKEIIHAKVGQLKPDLIFCYASTVF